MERYTRSVLIVEPDPVERERLGAALERDGFEVELCSGPTAPDYTCIGARVGRCPLVVDPCVVVLDTGLYGSGVAERTSTEDLLGFYLRAGHRVVTLNAQPTRGHDDERVVRLRRHPETDELLAAVWRSAAPEVSWSSAVRRRSA